MSARNPRHRLLRWGLPRTPRATENILTFVVVTVLTVAVTRALLAATGFPQVGGDSLHVAHVLWGGLLMAVAVVLALSFAGPLVRPWVAFIGGVGFGLFIDEVGKFLTSDNDYFFAPAPMIMYATVVVLMVAVDALHGRRPHHGTEYVAAAADHAVAGVAGGLSAQRRATAEDLLARGAHARGRAEVEALLAAIPPDEDEVPDPVTAAVYRLRRLFQAAATERRASVVTSVLLVLIAAGTATTAAATFGAGPVWAEIVVAASVVPSLAACVRGWTILRPDRYAAFQWLRRGVLVNLLITQVGLFRIAPWPATACLLLALATLGVVAAEKHRLERDHAAPA